MALCECPNSENEGARAVPSLRRVQEERFPPNNSHSNDSIVANGCLFERFEKPCAWAVKPYNFSEVKLELFLFNNRATKKKMSKSSKSYNMS